MVITIRIQDISYVDVAVRALPFLKSKITDEETTVNKLLCAITSLPKEMIHSLFEAIPQEEKNDIVSALVRENE